MALTTTAFEPAAGAPPAPGATPSVPLSKRRRTDQFTPSKPRNTRYRASRIVESVADLIDELVAFPRADAA